MAYQSTVNRPMWAGNGYTLPQHAFIPPQGTQQLATGRVADPVSNAGLGGVPQVKNAPNVTGSPANIHTYTFHL